MLHVTVLACSKGASARGHVVVTAWNSGVFSLSAVIPPPGNGSVGMENFVLVTTADSRSFEDVDGIVDASANRRVLSWERMAGIHRVFEATADSREFAPPDRV